MNKYKIKHYMHEIAQEEVPGVDLMPAIRKQLQQTHKRPVVDISSFIRVAAVLVTLIVTGAVGLTWVLQSYIAPGVPQEKIILIDQEKTIDEVIVRVDSAYADALRANINLTIEHPQSVNYGTIMDMQLTTADGIIILPAFSGGGAGGSKEANAVLSTSQTISFDMSTIENPPVSLDLVFRLVLGSDVFSNSSATSGGRGGGGGGTIASDHENVQNRVYQFEFTLPVLPAQVIEPVSASIFNSDVTMTIQDARYASSLFTFMLCYNHPDGGNWQPDIRIETASPDSPFTAHAILQPEQSGDMARCYNVQAPAAITDDTYTLKARVIQLYQPIVTITPELVEENEAFFAELGYDVRFDLNEEGYLMGFQVNAYPETMTNDEAFQFVSSNMFRKKYEGEWLFTFLLNGNE